MPAQIMQVLPCEKALVSIGGIQKEISTTLLDQVKLGDYVIIHVGYALATLDEAEAEKTLKLFESMLQQEV